MLTVNHHGSLSQNVHKHNFPSISRPDRQGIGEVWLIIKRSIILIKNLPSRATSLNPIIIILRRIQQWNIFSNLKPKPPSFSSSANAAALRAWARRLNKSIETKSFREKFRMSKKKGLLIWSRSKIITWRRYAFFYT